MPRIEIPAREVRPGDVTVGREIVLKVESNWGVVFVWLAETQRPTLTYNHGERVAVDRAEECEPIQLSDADRGRIFQALATEVKRLSELQTPTGRGAYTSAIERTRNLRDMFARTLP